MDFISRNNLCESEVDNIVSQKDKVQDMKINQLKLEIQDTLKKGEKCQQILKLLMSQML